MRPTLLAAAWFLSGLGLAGTASPAAAQTPAAAPGAGSVRLTVRDATGLPMAGASVALASPAGPAVAATTNDRGEAVFEAVAAGTYVALVEAAGFAPLERDAIVVRAGRRTNLTLELQIAGIEEQVEVVPDIADEPFADQLTAEQIEALPDDPEELAQVLEQMVGAGLDIRVNGFSGGELPRGAQIEEVRIRYDAASAGGRGDGPRVEIRTRPGSAGWRSRVDFGIRDERINARNAFSGERPAGQTRQYGWTLSGPIVRNRTGISLSLDRSDSFEQQAVRAARPDGLFSALVPQPSRRTGVSLEVEHALTRTQQLRTELRVGSTNQRNLGVSEFDLPERAYGREAIDGRLRVGHRATLQQRYVNNLRLQFGWQERDSVSVSDAATVRVLDAFTSGGAQIDGGVGSREIELDDELEFTLARVHQMSTGVTLTGTTYRADERRNAAGTFTFESLEALAAGLPRTFTQRIGDPRISYSTLQASWFVQDDYRVHPTVMLNLGLRHDFQTNLSDRANVAPRLGVNWSPFGARRTTLRASAGRFYQALDASLYEQTLVVNGRQQRDLVIENPGYPDPFAQGVARADRPPSIIRFAPGLEMPSTWRVSVGLDQPLTAWARLNATYSRRTGRDLLRSRDANAPIGGVRLDAAARNITQVESSGRSLTHSLETRLTLQYQPARLSGALRYTLGEVLDDSDGALALPPDSFDLSQQWGPGRQDIRHRLQASVNTDLWAGFRVDTNVRAQSASPYTITTGVDANLDGEYSERPPGVGRNSERGVGSANVDATLTWGQGFGRRAVDTGGGPNVQRGGGGNQGGRGGPGGGGEGRGGSRARDDGSLVRVEIFARATNLLNAVNPQRFSGVLTSPFYGLATSAAAARRVNMGMRLLF